MSKGHHPTRIDPINLPRRLRDGLDEAASLLEKGKTAEVLELLEDLDKHHPNQTYVLEMLVNAYLDSNDNHGYLRTLRKLHRLTPNRAEVKLGLASAYLANGHLVLALDTFRECLERWPQHEHAAEARKAVQQLEEGLPKVLEDGGLDFEKDFDFACQHEEVQVCLDTGEFGRAKSLIEKLQRQKPGFVAPLNNLSQILWLEGDLPSAIATCQKVLTIEPDNIHALGNLIRYLYMSGKKEEATPLIEQLKASKAEASERWIKIAETLSFVGDDAGMMELAERAEKEAHPLELHEYFYHLWAVSEALLGQESAAKSHWKRALKINARFELAQENLADLKKPKHERNGPWAYPFAQILPQKVIREMAHLVERASKSKDEDAFRPTVQRFLDAHPELLQLAPLILERGERPAKEFIINTAEMSGHPGFLSLIKEFAFGQKGPDDLRMEAAQVLSKHNAAPSGAVPMWMEGQWRPILLLGFEITPEPILDEEPMEPKTLKLMQQAIEALREDDGKTAEGYLRKALALQPEHPGLLNNLALALMLQGKKKESDAILKHLTDDFPEYFFGQMALARKSIQARKYDQARSILNHWMEKKKRYHVTEFDLLCKTQIDLMLAERQIDSALSWMEMWERTEPDDPDFEDYKERLGLFEAIEKLKGSRSRRKATPRSTARKFRD